MAVSYASGSQAISTSDKYNFKEMIEKLRAIEEIPARKLLKWKADWELRVDGFEQVKTSLTSLRDSLSKINSVDKFLVKSATSSNEAVVKATAASGAQAGDYTIDVQQLARNAIVAFSSSGLTSKDAVVNNTSQTQQFKYTYAGGEERVLDVAPGTTLTSLVNLINNDPKNPGVRATLIQDGTQFSFQLRGMDLGASKTLTINPSTNVGRLGSLSLNTGTNTATAPTAATTSFVFASGITGDTIVNDTGSAKDFTITYDGKTTTVTLDSGKKLTDLVAAINAKNGTTGVTASLSTSGGNTALKLTGNKKGTSASVGDIDITSDIESTTDGIDLSAGWNKVTGLNSTLTYGSFSAGTDFVNTSGTDQSFQYILNGTSHYVNVPNNTTVDGLIGIINASTATSGVSAALSTSGSPYSMILSGGGSTLADGKAVDAFGFGGSGISSSAATAPTANFNLGSGVTGTTVLNTTGSAQNFTFDYIGGGGSATISLAAGGTVNDLITAINAQKATTGVTASLGTSGNNKTLILTGNQKGVDSDSITVTTGINNGTIDLSTGWTQTAGHEAAIIYSASSFTSGTAVINSGSDAKNFQYFFNGTAYDVNVPAGTTLNGLRDIINASPPSGVNATISSSGPPYSLVIHGGSNRLAESHAAVNTLQFADASWTTQDPQNAQLKINGWPADKYLESTTNNVDGVIEGVTLNLRSKGTSEVVVATDNNAIKENVDAFIKAYNTFKTTYAVLTDVDTTKKTYDPDYTDSLFDMQQGGVLTGNYVVQMIGSQLSQIMSGAGTGFINAMNTPSTEEDPRESFWDPFSTLASIGIITDSDKNSTTFGLLIYNPDTKIHNGKTAFEVALADDPTAVAELFSANNLGSTNTSNFSFVNSLSGMTKSGAYDVSYDIDASGVITNAFIGGKPAIIDGNQLTANGDSTFDARGLTISVNSLLPGSYSGDKVFIKQGKANELYDAISMNDTKEDPVTHEMVNYKGAIGRMTDLIAQYMGDSSGDAKKQGIIKNIEAKIDKENQRLEVWQRFMTNKFARLEALLGKYEELQKSMESQIKNLSSSSS